LHTALLGSHASWTSGSWRPGRVHGWEGAGWWWRHCCCCRGRARTVSPAHPPSVLFTSPPTTAALDQRCCVRWAAMLSWSPGSWLYPAAAACTGCALCAVRCPFDAIRMVRTQPLIEDV